MVNTLDNAGLFLVQTLFGLYILILMLRVILQWAGAHFYNPVSQFILKLTNPVVTPVRRIISPLKGIDLASLGILLVLEFIKLLFVVWIKSGALAGFIGLLIMTIATVSNLILNIFFFAIFIQIIISWVNPQQRNPVTQIVYLIAEPALRPMRRWIPPIAGFDISPVPVLIALQLCAMVVIQPLLAAGLRLALN